MLVCVSVRDKQDVGGQDKIRPLWRHYFAGSQALVYVVDSSDRMRIDESRTELMRILSDRDMANVTLLVLANKSDMPGAFTPDEVAEKMGLNKLRDRTWYVQKTCATKGEGIREGFKWLYQNVR